MGKLIAGILVLAYPFLVYWGLSRYLDIRILAAILMIGFVVRALFVKGPSGLKEMMPLFGGIAVICLLAVFTGRGQFLLLYPILVNLVLLVTFGLTLRKPPSMIERFARLQEPDIPPEGVIYCRKVTWVWCGFFVVNAGISTFTVVHGDLKLWTLYNGFLGYAFMGLLFAVEYIVRRITRRRFEAQKAVSTVPPEEVTHD